MEVPQVVINERAHRSNAPVLETSLNDSMWQPHGGHEALKYRGSQQRADLVRKWQASLGEDYFTDYIRNSSFRKPNAYKTILHDNEEPKVTQDPKLHYSNGKVDALTARLLGGSVLTPDEERDLFRRYNFVRYLLTRVVASLDPETASYADIREVQHYRAEVIRMRNKLFQANAKLAVAPTVRIYHPLYRFGQVDLKSSDNGDQIAVTTKSKDPQFHLLVSAATSAIYSAIDGFDFARNNKFSTYCCRAIIRDYLRLCEKEAKFARRAMQGDEKVIESIPAPINEVTSKETLDRSRKILMRLIQSELTPIERLIIRARLPLRAGMEGKTLQEVGERIGLTRERVRQIQDRALKKIRLALLERGEDLGSLL